MLRALESGLAIFWEVSKDCSAALVTLVCKHVRDAARAVRLVLEAPADTINGHAFNAGDTSQNYQKGSLVELIQSQIGDHCQVERVHKIEDPRDYRVSFDKISRQLGFTMTRTVQAGVREIIAAISDGLFTDFDNARYRN